MDTKLIKDIQNDMKSFYKFDLTDKQVIEYLKVTPLKYFDTIEREDFVNFLANKITGMDQTCYGDSETYKKEEFYKKMNENIEKFGYVWL